MPTQFTLAGTVIDQTTGKGLAGLRVEAWDRNFIYDDQVGNALTDDEGKFAILIMHSKS